VGKEKNKTPASDERRQKHKKLTKRPAKKKKKIKRSQRVPFPKEKKSEGPKGEEYFVPRGGQSQTRGKNQISWERGFRSVENPRWPKARHTVRLWARRKKKKARKGETKWVRQPRVRIALVSTKKNVT